MLSAGVKKEALYLERFGRPLFPMDRMRRETFNLEKQLRFVCHARERQDSGRGD